ncbi:unnamed protein product [Lactuca saligna]|uniref:Uncharacterized protein n=1 Tax=Lactuca saligna TaxID=75948 RepID=A0AA35VZ59_LACSI|nr:unnamed protein product [Lactuca saligna]
MGGLIAGLVIHMHLVIILILEHILIDRLSDGPRDSPLSAIVEGEDGDSRVGKNEISDPLRTIPCETTPIPATDVVHVYESTLIQKIFAVNRLVFIWELDVKTASQKCDKSPNANITGHFGSHMCTFVKKELSKVRDWWVCATCHTPKEEELIFCDLAYFFAGKSCTYQDAMGNAEALVNDRGCFIPTDTRKDTPSDFHPKGLMIEFSR